MSSYVSVEFATLYYMYGYQFRSSSWPVGYFVGSLTWPWPRLALLTFNRTQVPERL